MALQYPQAYWERTYHTGWELYKIGLAGSVIDIASVNFMYSSKNALKGVGDFVKFTIIKPARENVVLHYSLQSTHPYQQDD